MKTFWICVALLWGFAAAQSDWVGYRGQLENLEFSGPDCPTNLPKSYEVRLLQQGDGGYLLGKELTSSRLNNNSLDLAGITFEIQWQTSLDQAKPSGQVSRQTPSQTCLLSKATLQLERGNLEADWLKLAQAEYGANTVLGQGQYAEAAAAYEQAFSLSRQLRGESELVWQLRTLEALALNQLGRNGEAFVLYQEATSNLSRLIGPTGINTLIARQGMASSLLAVGRYAEAEQMARELAAQAEQATGASSLITLNALRTLSTALNDQKRNNEALEIAQTVYTRARQAFGPSDIRTFNEWRGWANALYLAGQREASLRELEQIYAQAKAVLGADHYEVLMTLEQLANLSSVLSQSEQALSYLQLAETAAKGQLGFDSLRSQRLLTARAGILWQMDRRKEAKPLYAQSIEQLERLRTQPLPAEERRRLLRDNLVIYQNYMLLLAQDSDLPELFRVSELSKGRTLLETLATQQAVQAAVLPPDAVQKLTGYQQSFTRLEQALQTAVEPQRSELLAQRLRLSQENANFEQSLQTQYPRYGELSQPKLLDLEGAAALAAEDTTLVSFVDMDEILMAFVVTPERVSVVGTALSPNLEGTITAYRRLLETPDGGLGLERQGQRVYRLPDGSFSLRSTSEPPPQGAQRVTDWRAISQVLGQTLIQPIVDKLEAKVHRLVISPDGPLAFLPFETLRVEGGLLLERYAISYTPSLSVYGQLKSFKPSSSYTADLLALGNPAYNQNALSTNLTRSPILDTLQKRNFRLVALPGAEQEAKAAASLFASRAQVWTGSEASLEHLQTISSSGSLAQYRYLLLAAHGFVDAEAPDQVAVLLSQSAKDDGVLDMGRVVGLRLNSNLVILSACNTGLGLNVRGEGVMGLAYAFFVAGSNHTLLTQWAINDASSSQFSPKLLEHLKSGLPLDEALRQTKLEFLRRPELAHPAYWAAFVLY